MENKPSETLGIETEKNKKNCKKIRTIIIFLTLTFILLILITMFFNLRIISFADGGRNYSIIENIVIILFFIIPLIWVFLIPIYSIIHIYKGLIEPKCFKKIMIIWSLPVLIPLIAAGGCLFLFSMF